MKSVTKAYLVLENLSEYQTWLLSRFALPIAAALFVVLMRWGLENVYYILSVPIFLLLIRIYIGYLEKPEAPELDHYKPFRIAIRKWHNTEVISLVVLMVFEIVNAAFTKNRDADSLLKNFLICSILYTSLAFRARTWLLRARKMANFAQEFLIEKEMEC